MNIQSKANQNSGVNILNTEKDIKLEIGRRIREQRKVNGFKTSQTYRDLEIPRTTYTGYEMGARTPDPATMNRIANYLNTTVSYLMCETNDPEIQNPTSSFEELLEEKNLTFEGKPLTNEQWEILFKTLKNINDNNSTDTNTNTKTNNTKSNNTGRVSLKNTFDDSPYDYDTKHNTNINTDYRNKIETYNDTYNDDLNTLNTNYEENINLQVKKNTMN